MKTKKNTNPKSFLQKTKGIPESREFLASLRGKLVLHMKINPSAEETSSFVYSPLYYGMALSILVLFLILTAGGTSLASQNSLPGDLLYPVKIFSEQISVATSFTPESRSRARLLIASERVHEAVALAQTNSTKPDKNNEQFHAAMQSVMDNFNTQVSATLVEENNLRAKNDTRGALKIANNIQNATDTFNNVLLNVKEQEGNGETDDVDRFINSNNDFNARAEIESKNSNDEKDSPNQPAFKSDKNDSQDEHRDEQKGKSKSENGANSSDSQATVPTSSTLILAAPIFTPVPGKTVPNTPDGSQDKHGNENDNNPASSASVLSSPAPAASPNTSGSSLPVEQKKSDSGNTGDSQKKDGGNKNDGGNQQQ